VTAEALSDPGGAGATTEARGGPRLGWRGALASALYRSGPYRAWLRRHPPQAIAWIPGALHVGSAARANAMFQGRYTFAGHTVQSAREAPWRRNEVSPAWLRACHEFGWLADFAAADGATARKQARELIRRWLADFGRWTREEWLPETLARRLIAWLTHADFLLVDAEPDFGPLFLRAIGEQLRHLRRVQGRTAATPARAMARASFLIGNMALAQRVSGWDRVFERLLLDVEDVAAGRSTRNPSQLLRVLETLLTLNEAMAANGRGENERLGSAIAALSATLRTVTHGDGRFAVLHGGDEEDRERIAAVVSRHAPRAVPAGAPGVARLQQARLLVIAQTADEVPNDDVPNLSTLALEVSVGKERLFVNCGRPDNDDADWQNAARATAAHSALVIDDYNQELASAASATPHVLRGEEGDSVWLDLSAPTYMQRFGVRLARRLHAAKDGHELVCEDQVLPAGPETGAAPQMLCARLHLHPRVNASLLGGGRQVLLKLGNGTGWMFELADDTAQIEDSVYFGEWGRARRTKQIVVNRKIENRASRVMWHLMRLDGRA